MIIIIIIIIIIFYTKRKMLLVPLMLFGVGNHLKHPSTYLVKDIFSYTNSLQNFSFAHTLRQDNALTHALA